MSGTTISSTTTSALHLTLASQSPVTVTQTGEIDAPVKSAIYGASLSGILTISNFGTLEAALVQSNYTVGIAISLAGSGLIENGTGAYISGKTDGVYADGELDVMNAGTITSDYGAGIALQGGGTIINGSATNSAAYISGIGTRGTGSSLIDNFGTVMGINTERPTVIFNGSEGDTAALVAGSFTGVALNHGGTLVNFGTVANALGLGPSWDALALHGDGTVINHGLVDGGVLLVAAYGSDMTLVNAGTISDLGTSDIAVRFGYEPEQETGRVIVLPGAVFNGLVEGFQPSNGTTTLELAAGDGIGTISGIGTQFTNFEAITIDTGATWLVAGDVAGLADQQVIAGFAAGDTIVLDGFANTSYSYVSGTGLELSLGTLTETLDITGSFVTSEFSVSSVDGDVVIELTSCFAAGTRILTPDGEVAVERLAVGQRVITQAGEEAPIMWIGRRQLDLRRHVRPAAVQPVRVAADAFADGVPARDLVLSPDHALLLEGHLVPAKALVNGMNVTQLNRESVTYYHVELAAHDVIFAERLAVESYLETGNRGGFENGGTAMLLHPEFAQAMREAASCAPFTETGPVVAAARKLLCERGFTQLVKAVAGQR